MFTTNRVAHATSEVARLRRELDALHSIIRYVAGEYPELGMHVLARWIKCRAAGKPFDEEKEVDKLQRKH